VDLMLSTELPFRVLEKRTRCFFSRTFFDNCAEHHSSHLIAKQSTYLFADNGGQYERCAAFRPEQPI
jgi:hypothetical protein